MPPQSLPIEPWLDQARGCAAATGRPPGSAHCSETFAAARRRSRAKRLPCHIALSIRGPQVALQCYFLLSYLLDAAAVAASGLVADRLGQGERGEARRVAWRCWIYAAGAAALCAAVLGLAPHSVAAVFTDSLCVPALFVPALCVS